LGVDFADQGKRLPTDLSVSGGAIRVDQIEFVDFLLGHELLSIDWRHTATGYP
jgi:hypothetical protein